jgi:DNA invertase Pin-like site-specific DNA recombinase
MRAAISVRVSEEDQAESGAGIAAQTDACMAYAQRHGIEVIGIFADEAVSGSLGLEKRPGLLQAIAALGKGDILLVAKRDRIGRLEPMAMAMIERAVQRKGARIISAAGEGTESDSPDAILMRRMIDAFAEYERLVIGARTSAAMQAMKRRGERVGAIPFGYRLDVDGVHLVEDEAEQEVIRLVRELKAEGLSIRKIADEMNRRGIASKEGGRWHIATVQRVLKAA